MKLVGGAARRGSDVDASVMPAESAAAAASGRGAFQVAILSLQRLTDLVGALNDEQYVRKPVGVFSGSLGGHVRHCLDHFEAFLAGEAGAVMDYDDRRRGTPVEVSRAAALQAISRLGVRLSALNGPKLNQPVRVRSMLTADGGSITNRSTLGRELAFVLSHTIHHEALIAAMCATMGVPVPERFGYAPSTAAHLDRIACAPSRSSG